MRRSGVPSCQVPPVSRQRTVTTPSRSVSPSTSHSTLRCSIVGDGELASPGVVPSSSTAGSCPSQSGIAGGSPVLLSSTDSLPAVESGVPDTSPLSVRLSLTEVLIVVPTLGSAPALLGSVPPPSCAASSPPHAATSNHEPTDIVRREAMRTTLSRHASAAAGGRAAGVALQAGAVAHHREALAVRARVALVA